MPTPNFLVEIRSSFDVRYWEMYLTMALIDLGFDVLCPKPGPDVGIEVDGQRIWFEATSPSRGADGAPVHRNAPPIPNVCNPFARWQICSPLRTKKRRYFKTGKGGRVV
jgi:hypothetical protein